MGGKKMTKELRDRVNKEIKWRIQELISLPTLQGIRVSEGIIRRKRNERVQGNLFRYTRKFFLFRI